MPLGASGYAVGKRKTGVEPLRRVGRAQLSDERVGHLVLVGLRVVFGIEVAVFFSPRAPAAGHAEGHLLNGGLHSGLGFSVFVRADAAVGVLFRNAGLAQVFLSQNIGRDLRPKGRYLDVLDFRYDLAVGVANNGVAFLVGKLVIDIFTGPCPVARYLEAGILGNDGLAAVGFFARAHRKLLFAVEPVVIGDVIEVTFQ